MKDPRSPPRRGRPTTFNKVDVTQIAMRAYWEIGPTDVSLNAICKKAGVSKPSVYREFGNEDGLSCAALENYAQHVLGKVLAILVGKDSFAHKIRQVAFMAAQDATHDHGCLFVKMRAAKAQMGKNTQALIVAMDGMAIDAYAKLMKEAQDTGEWTSDIPIHTAAEFLHAQIGLALDRRARGEDPGAVLSLALSVLGRDLE